MFFIGNPSFYGSIVREDVQRKGKKQKTDRNDARLLRRLLLENNFPVMSVSQRIGRLACLREWQFTFAPWLSRQRSNQRRPLSA